MPGAKWGAASYIYIIFYTILVSMMPTYSFFFDKIYILESLPSEEIQTGTALYKETILRTIEQKKLEINCQLFSIQNRSEFFDALNCIKKEVITNNHKPIIHLELHGDENGVQLKSNELVLWEDLGDILREINFSSQNNTLLTLAVCYGTYIYKTIKVNKTSPFWGTVSSQTGINPSKTLGGYQSFFETLLTSFNINKSVNELNKEYEIPLFVFRHSKLEFEKAYESYETTYLTEEVISQRVEEMFVQVKVLYLQKNILNVSDDKIRNDARILISLPEIQAKMKNDTYLKFTNNGKFSN